MPRRFYLFLYSLSAALLVGGCAAKSTRERLEERQNASRARAASYGADGFYRDGNFSQKPPGQHEFFYKRCSLSGRHPYPSSTDWECTDPD